MNRPPRKLWYFVCQCGAKFFAKENNLDCPRCGETLESTEQMEPPWTNRYLTIREAAQRLRASPRSIYGLCQRGLLVHFKLPGVGVRISEEAIEEFLKAYQRTGTGKPLRISGPRQKLRHLRV